MALSIRAQALSLLPAFGLGLGLGLLYDMFRPIRRRGGDGLWDGLFCLCAACLSFLPAMRAETGALGTGELLLSLLGLLTYFRFLSPVCFPIFETIAANIRVLSSKAQVSIKKVWFSAKKLFQNQQG